MSTNSKLLVVVGETASGKSTLALQLAQRFNGEIICADSSTVRKEADIGTAKPSPDDRNLVRHHLLDIAEPDEKFTAARFKHLAIQAIQEITGRGKLPIMVGGSGLYIDSIVYDYSFDQTTKAEASDRHKIRDNTLIIGLRTDREILKQQLHDRLEAQLAAGLEQEVQALEERYGWQAEALRAISYAEWQPYFKGSHNLAETRQAIIKNSLGLAKRQRTWFKRNKSIQWLDTPVKPSTVVDLVTTFLNA